MHVAKTYVLVPGVDLQRRRLLLRRADHRAVADGQDRPLARLAAIGAFAARRTRCGPDILPLMAKTAGTLPHAKTAGFAKRILPGITGIAAKQLVAHERFVVRSAVPERLRMGEGRGLSQWKPKFANRR